MIPKNVRTDSADPRPFSLSEVEGPRIDGCRGPSTPLGLIGSGSARPFSPTGLACLGLVALAACATLDTSTMNARCKDLYNACLDGCPKPMRNPNRDTASLDLDMVTPSCVDQCNKDAKLCQ